MLENAGFVRFSADLVHTFLLLAFWRVATTRWRSRFRLLVDNLSLLWYDVGSWDRVHRDEDIPSPMTHASFGVHIIGPMYD